MVSCCLPRRSLSPSETISCAALWYPASRVLNDGHSRGSGRRPSSHHRVDAACPVGDDRRLAEPRIPPRKRRCRPASRTSSSTCSSRGRSAAAPKTSRRRSIRSAANSTRSPPRSTRATTSRCSTITCRSRSICCRTSSAGRSSTADEIEREKKVILEEIKMVEDTPDDLVHEVFSQHFWEGHPLGRPILGTAETVQSFTADTLRRYFATSYVAPNRHHCRGRQRRARARPRPDHRRVPRHSSPGRFPSWISPRASCRRSSFAQRNWSRATSAWGRPATRRSTTTGT